MEVLLDTIDVETQKWSFSTRQIVSIVQKKEGEFR